MPLPSRRPIPPLLSTRRFLPLFVTQFLGAFNDNLFKNALVMLIAYRLAGEGDAQLLVTLAAGLFILPFFLFSALAGQLADKFDRARIARATKIWEIIIMVVGAVGLYAGNVPFLLFVLFCLGAQSAFFGPVKYALLPQHLADSELVAGNGWIEAGTFLAILVGTIAGGLLAMSEAGTHLISMAVIVCALAGYLASRHIPAAPPPMPALALNWNLPQETWLILKNDRTNPRVWRSIIGISWFWLIGATFLSQFPTYAKYTLGSDESVVTLLLTVFSIGIGLGSMLCAKVLKGEISAKYVPWAALGISLFTLDLCFAGGPLQLELNALPLNAWDLLTHGFGGRVVFDLFIIAVCGGLYIVPLYAILQHESDPATRARTIASNNVLNALFMVLAAAATVGMLVTGFSVPQVFLTIAIINGTIAWRFFRRRL